MLDHAHALLGTFITSVTMVGPGWWQIRSTIFPDEVDWNLGVIEPSVAQTTVPASSAVWTATAGLDSQGVRRGRLRGRSRARVIGTEHWLMRDLVIDPQPDRVR